VERSALRGGSLDFRARLAMRRAACSEHTVACGAIPALLVTLPDIDLYTTEVMQDQDDTGPPQLAASFITGSAGRDRGPRWPPGMKRGGPANRTAR